MSIGCGRALFQREGECSAHALFAAHRNALAVCLDDMFDYGQTQTRASLLARAALVDTVEALEDAVYVLLADAYAVVLYLDQYLVEHVAELDVGHAAALTSVADRVYYKVDQHLPDIVLVGRRGTTRAGCRST